MDHDEVLPVDIANEMGAARASSSRAGPRCSRPGARTAPSRAHTSRRETLEEEVTRANNEAGMAGRRHPTDAYPCSRASPSANSSVQLEGAAPVVGSCSRDKSVMPAANKWGKLSTGNPTPALRQVYPAEAVDRNQPSKTAA